ncbi:hypothetical protein [Microbispora amethystogenes]|uniref:Uncharacterized protein n=1 Tax=Microbispora amethystogenes TaxID=1427754 RepID=A0ABQ4FMU9_9ACTN|nr:hypothetical protein [Microbispora amethystogenes]GIH36078.1 hypothetical protein Mam01_62420 [Microbispora amethystogenes]
MRTFSKALSVVAVAAALSATTMTSPASAAVTIKVEQVFSQTVWEWTGYQFTCPQNQVLTGRSHYGDENAKTTYYCSRILINGLQVEVHAGDWTSPQRESKSDYSAPNDQVVVGRWHEGDENGYTRYRSAALYWSTRQIRLVDGEVSGQYTESSHTWQARAGKVMTGRTHYGDENGKTTYRSASVYFEE